MENFMNCDFNISTIALSCFVAAGTGAIIHKNRAYHGLALHLSGNKDYCFSDGKVVSVKKGSIIYLPKGSSYVVKNHQIGDCYAINFDISNEDFSSAPFAFKPKSPATVEDYFRTALKSWRGRIPGYIMVCKSELFKIICSMQKDYFSEYAPASKLELIRPAIDYIHSKYTEELIKIDFLASMCKMTPEYFRKLFRNFYGDSPLVYINKLKMLHAKELIDSGLYSITEAALSSGYSDISHFSREFKKHYGISPTDYKKRL